MSEPIQVEPPIRLADGLAAIVLHPGDILILRSNEPMGRYEAERVSNMAKKAGITNPLILDSTTDVFVLQHKAE